MTRRHPTGRATTWTQYRSAIFVMSDEQRRVAEAVKACVNASGKWNRPSSPRWFKQASSPRGELLTRIIS